MRTKTKNMKFIINKAAFKSVVLMQLGLSLSAQELVVATQQQDSVKQEEDRKFNPNKRIDGVVAVVGDHVILDSDIDKMYLEIRQRRSDLSEFSRCQIIGRLMEDKMYAHHAVQDSVMVSDAEINSIVENNIEYLLNNVGSMDKVLEYYR